MNMKNFKMNNLKTLREKKNITQIKLSVDIGLSQEIISHYEIGQSKPNIENLIKIADYFHCSTDYLLNRTNIPNVIENVNTSDIEISDIVTKYKSLNPSNKESFKSYIEYLCNNNQNS